jgi:hypothetical protein
MRSERSGSPFRTGLYSVPRALILHICIKRISWTWRFRLRWIEKYTAITRERGVRPGTPKRNDRGSAYLRGSYHCTTKLTHKIDWFGSPKIHTRKNRRTPKNRRRAGGYLDNPYSAVNPYGRRSKATIHHHKTTPVLSYIEDLDSWNTPLIGVVGHFCGWGRCGESQAGSSSLPVGCGFE